MSTPLRFAGQQYDAESGLHYNRHRFYNPETASYTSPDPLGVAPNLASATAYVHNPHTWVDPLGLKAACSKALGKALENAGFKKFTNAEAHHMVAGKAMGARRVRKILDKHGIDVNDADNGVWLHSRAKTKPSVMRTFAHRGDGLHTKSYYDAVNTRTRTADAFGGKSAVHGELHAIRSDLISGHKFW